MAQRIEIDPVSRVEGHAKISLHLDDNGQVAEARLHIVEFRGFEQFCIGRPLWEMPGITARICGICPVSHLLASAKAGDMILAVDVPPAAQKLRRLLNLAQIIQSHALSFFHLSAPDLLFGMESDPSKRNLFGLIATDPEFARGGIKLRQFGQAIIEALGGSKIHPAWVVAGGVRSALSRDSADEIRAGLPEALQTAQAALKQWKKLLGQFADEVQHFGNFGTLFMGLVGANDAWEHYDGQLRVIDSNGVVMTGAADPLHYDELIGEAVEPWSYLKFPYYRQFGYPAGSYRVGPLARLNICRSFGTPLADRELTEFRERGGQIVTSSFFYHYARLIEILGALEQVGRLVNDPELHSSRLRAHAGINRSSGVGVSEAPRGTLFHHYQVDERGIITGVNMIIATGQNNLAMNRAILQIAQHYVDGNQISEGMLNRVEAGIRAFDPCLSCSTHAAGSMPLQVSLFGADGRLLDEVLR